MSDKGLGAGGITDGGAAQATDRLYALRDATGTPTDVRLEVQNLAAAVIEAAELDALAVAGGYVSVDGIDVEKAVDIRRYGASTGATASANTTAINAAIAAAAGRSVYIPPGTFSHNGITLAANTELFGAGPSSILSLANAANASSVSLLASATGVTLRNFAINGNKANQTAGSQARGVYLVNAHRCKISGLYIYDTEDHGIHLSNAGTQSGNIIESNSIEDCGLSNSSVGGSGIAITSGLDDVITGNSIRGSWRAGIRTGGAGHTITGNLVEGNGNGGLIFPSGLTSDLTIVGNTIRDNYNAAGSAPTEHSGVRLVGVDKAVITGNSIFGNGGSGVDILNGANDIVVTGNIIRNNAQSATGSGVRVFQTGTTPQNIIITSNRIYDDQGSPTQQYGLSFENSCDNIRYGSNYLSGHVSGDVNNTSSGTNIKIVAVADLAVPQSTAREVAANLRTWHVISQSGVQVPRASVNGAGDATEATLLTVTIPANAMGPNGSIRWRVQWSYNNSANVKTLRTRLGGVGGTLYHATTATTTVGYIEERQVWNRNSASSQVGAASALSGGIGSTTGTIATSSIDTTAAVDLVFRCNWAGAVAAETIAIESYCVEVCYGA